METVILRPFAPKDVAVLAGLFAEPAVRQWNPEGRDVEAWCAQANRRDDDSRTWAVADPFDDRLLGTVSVFDRVGADAEIGYRVLAAESGRGIATATVRVAVARAEVELSLARVRLVHAVANAASCRVAVKAGFQSERTVPGTEVYGDGLLHEEHLHLYRRALGPDEFRGTHPPAVPYVRWPDVDGWE